MKTYLPAARGLAILLLALSLATPTLANTKVALLRASEGEVTVQGTAARKFQPLRVGDKLALQANSALTVDYLKSGLRQVATGPATLTVTEHGLKGSSVVTKQAARLASLQNIGAQKKIGGGSVRGDGKPADLKIHITYFEGQPRFEVLDDGIPYQGEYYAAIFHESDLEFGWEQEPLVGSIIPVPDHVLKAMKPGQSYTISVGLPEQLELMQGRRLRCQVIPQDQLEDLDFARRSLEQLAAETNDAQPLLLLMDLYNEKDMVEKAAEAGSRALRLALKAKTKPIYLDELTEALDRLYTELDDQDAIERTQRLSAQKRW